MLPTPSRTRGPLPSVMPLQQAAYTLSKLRIQLLINDPSRFTFYVESLVIWRRHLSAQGKFLIQLAHFDTRI